MTMLMQLTLSDALAHARYTYRTVAVRAFDLAVDERDYVAALAGDWDERLAEIRTDTNPLSEDKARVLDDLTLAVSDPELSSVALVEWVDAFPAAVIDLFAVEAIADQSVHEDASTGIEWLIVPSSMSDAYVTLGSGATVDAEFDTSAEAGNRQSTLALAA
jgi:hypothetical protein